MSLIPMAAVVAALTLTACGEKSDAPAAAGDGKAATATLEKVAATASDAAGKVVAQAKEALDKAQQLVGQAKFQEAQDVLKTIESLKLTPEQQKSLSDLKAKIDQGITAAKSAAKSIPALPKP